MPRALVGVVLAIVFCAGNTPAEEEKEKPKDRPAIPGEKVDAKGNRVLTGTVESIETKDEKNGILVVRTSGANSRSKFWVDNKTKVLQVTADPLEGGLKSPVLMGAEVRITFVERQSQGVPPDLPVCQMLQVLKPAK